MYAFVYGDTENDGIMRVDYVDQDWVSLDDAPMKFPDAIYFYASIYDV